MSKLLEQLIHDKERLFDLGISSVRRAGVNIRVSAIRAITHGGDIPHIVATETAKIAPSVSDMMIAAHLHGRLRSMVTAAEKLSSKTVSAFGPYESAVDFVRRKLELSEDSLNTIREKYGDASVRAVGEIGGSLHQAAVSAMADIVEQTMTTNESIKYMREVMELAGVDTINPWLLETMVRTQIAVAYSAGRWNANQDPAIQEILWGYEYVTVGDDRVRFEHEAMDGAIYPKDHAFWETNWPPNGYNCRCDVLELFNDESPTITERFAEPDEGWAVNHGVLYDDMLVASV